VGHVAALLMAFVTIVAAAQPETVRTFDEDRVDAPPAGFVFSGTAETRADRWLVRRERNNNVLVHFGDPERRRRVAGDPERGRGNAGDPGRSRGSVADPERRRRFALALLDGPRRTNLSVVASFKNAGRTGRAGFVWRYQDSQNFYIVHLDLDEADQEIGLYRVVNGNWARIGVEEDLQLQHDWQTLKVVHANETIRVYLSGIKVFDVRDKTFRGPGAVGLWSAADTVMYFDNLSVSEDVRR
jgi:hypothetical protein